MVSFNLKLCGLALTRELEMESLSNKGIVGCLERRIMLMLTRGRQNLDVHKAQSPRRYLLATYECWQ